MSSTSIVGTIGQSALDLHQNILSRKPAVKRADRYHCWLVEPFHHGDLDFPVTVAASSDGTRGVETWITGHPPPTPSVQGSWTNRAGWVGEKREQAQDLEPKWQ